MPCPPLPCLLINVIMKKPIKESVVLRAIQRPPGLLEAFFEIACPCPFVSTGARYHENGNGNCIPEFWDLCVLKDNCAVVGRY